MKTLYLRNVPDEVSEALRQLAGEAGMSVSAFAVKELGAVASRARNRAVLDGLPDLGIPIEAIVDALHAGREER